MPLLQQRIRSGDLRPGAIKGYPLDQVYNEVALIACHFHWNYEAILNMDHNERRKWCEEISKINVRKSKPCKESLSKNPFAEKITPRYTWTDIVLTATKKEQLKEICIHAKQYRKALRDWGSEKHFSRKGITVLFSGPSGTGKTMAAEIIANDLGLDIFKIDLSMVVSKYIGETEKNLNRIFKDAEESNAILFFDEADALFGERSEVKDSHDRYANVEINYLLQKMEEHEGIVILATNFRKNIEDAFLRRIRFIVDFPFPTSKYRQAIWKKVFPEKTVVENIDFATLSKMKITGGSIKNIALTAAFLAAESSNKISMDHIAKAAKREFRRLGKVK